MKKTDTKREHGARVILNEFPDNVRSLWQRTISEPGVDSRHAHTLEALAVGKTTVLVHDYGNGDGWTAYLPATESNRVDETLQAIGARAHVTAASQMGMDIGAALPEDQSYYDLMSKTIPHFYAVSDQGRYGIGLTEADAIRNCRAQARIGTRMLIYHVDAGTELYTDGSFVTPAGRRTPTLIKRLQRKGTRWIAMTGL